MPRQAQRARPREYQRQPAGQSFPIPAPSLGMNTRDSVSALDPREARLIENMIADGGKLKIRRGKTSHQTIPGAASVGSVYTHNGVTGDVLLAAADGEIWDVTGAPDDLTSANYALDFWSIAQFNDTTIGVNGTDTPWAFDGSAVGASGFSGSGLTIANLRTVCVVQNRLWFTEEGSADVWYGALNGVTGALTKFQLSQETKGGYCVGVYPWKVHTVFVMSSGEVVIYSGDPATTFKQAGVYNSPIPVGYDPGVAVGGDLIIMTSNAPIPLDHIAAGVAFDTTLLNTWGKIATSWADDWASYQSFAPWNAVYINGLVIFNIPTDIGTSKQWVYNTRSKAWSTFSNLNASQFAAINNTIYFGDRGAGEVFANAGGTDEGASIVATVRAGFTYPFENQVNGQYTLARINCTVNGLVTAQIQVDVDFVESGINAPEVNIGSAGSGPWDGPWDEPWGEDGRALLRWHKVKGFGRAVAPVVRFHSSADTLEYSATDLVVAPAGILGTAARST